MTSWIFQANPKTFDIDACLAAGPATLLWLVRQLGSEMRLGDQVFIWRAIGGGAPKLSGIIAEATIEELPALQPEAPESLPFWREPTPVASASADLRVKLRLTRIELKDRFQRGWFDDDPVLAKMAILTRRTGTNFRLNQCEATRLNALWRRAKVPWTYGETVAGLWAFQRTRDQKISRLPGSPVSEAAMRTGRVVKTMYAKVLNFRNLDPIDSRKGWSGTSLRDREVWARFYDQASGGLRADHVDSEYARLWPEDPLPLLPSQPSVDKSALPLEALGLTELLARYAKSGKGKGAPVKPRTYRTSTTAFERDPLVVAIARVRSDHSCEVPACAHPPFFTTDGRRFVEVHHIVPLGEGGEDTTDNVACVCPAHHREAHHGAAAASLSAALHQVRAGAAAVIIAQPTTVAAPQMIAEQL
jgi:hypothetical protein